MGDGMIIPFHLKPVSKPMDFPPDLRGRLRREYAVRYLEAIGASPTRENMQSILKEVPIDGCDIVEAFRCRGWLTDALYVRPKKGMAGEAAVDHPSLKAMSPNGRKTAVPAPPSESKSPGSPGSSRDALAERRRQVRRRSTTYLSKTLAARIKISRLVQGSSRLLHLFADSATAQKDKEVLALAAFKRPPDVTTDELVEAVTSLTKYLNMKQFLPRLDGDSCATLLESLEPPRNAGLVRLLGLAAHYAYWLFLLPWARSRMAKNLRDNPLIDGVAAPRLVEASEALLTRPELSSADREDLYVSMVEQFNRLQEDTVFELRVSAMQLALLAVDSILGATLRSIYPWFALAKEADDMLDEVSRMLRSVLDPDNYCTARPIRLGTYQHSIYANFHTTSPALRAALKQPRSVEVRRWQHRGGAGGGRRAASASAVQPRSSPLRTAASPRRTATPAFGSRRRRRPRSRAGLAESETDGGEGAATYDDDPVDVDVDGFPGTAPPELSLPTRARIYADALKRTTKRYETASLNTGTSARYMNSTQKELKARLAMLQMDARIPDQNPSSPTTRGSRSASDFTPLGSQRTPPSTGPSSPRPRRRGSDAALPPARTRKPLEEALGALDEAKA
mmetsp:Transcript_31452/g.99740  ORF Transcript_31452/g.99740 Transcript_31452/m.99740 type:complete len:622 (-) Transcript_31452:59-1924(-)